jgi:UDP-N-acetylmuramyl pentapeptide phosphotransferase/UDP-N-acetylglucosamine-1-phosphate transferase
MLFYIRYSPKRPASPIRSTAVSKWSLYQVSNWHKLMLDTSAFPDNWWPFAVALGCALAVSVLLVLTKEHHGHLTLDSDIGVQKFHVEPTPRVGGLAIYLGLAMAWLLVRDEAVKDILGVILLAGLPALACGLTEDVTKKIGVAPRLLATVASGVLACMMSGLALDRLGVPGLDWIMTVTPVAVIFTAIMIAGVANAINIIDGFHGLASGTTIIALLALAAIAVRADDPPMAVACVAVAAAVGGFWLVNYPWGKLFMGDGGAYFVGFALAWLAVLLPVRNPEVSVWAPLLVCAYPVIEVVYSVVRRYAGHHSPGAPDSGHLHSLIKKKLIRQKLGWMNKGARNAAVAPVIWVFTSLAAMAAVAAFDRPLLLMIALISCLLLYHLAYRYLAARRTPVMATLPGSLEIKPYQFEQHKHQTHLAKPGRAATGR